MKVRALLVTVGLVAASLVTPLVATAQETPQDAAAPQHAQRHRGVAMDTITDLLGVTRGDVISNVRTGGTIAELAEENGSSGEAVVDALMAVADERIDAALDAEKIDEERAAEIRAKVLERVTNLVFETHDGPRGPRGNPGIGNGEFRNLIMDTVQESLDINRGQLVSHIRSGGTLTGLAEDNGSDGPTLEADLVAAVSDGLDAAVADGGLTDEQAADLLERATARISELMVKVFQPGNGR